MFKIKSFYSQTNFFGMLPEKKEKRKQIGEKTFKNFEKLKNHKIFLITVVIF